MSRGLGQIQKLVLAEVAKRPYFYLMELLPPNFTESQYQSLYRACQTLANKRMIGIWGYLLGRPKMGIKRFGYNDPVDRPKFKCLPRAEWVVTKHLQGGEQCQ